MQDGETRSVVVRAATTGDVRGYYRRHGPLERAGYELLHKDLA
jgi:hypothetical protein